ncbi:MAG: ABC transporter substrate-binding protein [Hydrogenophaga sp.]|nr:ABC transporter substrate-binding protein [Hydrogenophaga sp.]
MSKWDRRDWCRLCAAAWVGSVLSTSHAQRLPGNLARPRSGTVVVAVDNRSSFCYLPLTIADRLGYFAAEGVDVQLREFADVAQSVQAVRAGAAQLYSGPYSSTIALQARGHMFQSIVLQGRAPQIVLGVSLKTMPHYRELRDLRGKRVGVTALGSGSHRTARLLLAKAGILAHEVQYLSLPNASAAMAACRAGQIEAICYTDPVITALEQGADVRVVADTRTVQGNAEVFGGPMPAGCLIAPDEFLSTQPRRSQAVADAIVHALKWLQTAGPSDLIKTVPEPYFAGDRALYLAAFSRVREAWATDGLMPADGPSTAVRTLSRLDEGAALQRVDLARTYTNEFARRSKAKFRA